jgi:hypothetical protein
VTVRAVQSSVRVPAGTVLAEPYEPVDLRDGAGEQRHADHGEYQRHNDRGELHSGASSGLRGRELKADLQPITKR